MTEVATHPRYRYIGCNDEQTVCDQCGKVDLGRTVVLAVLDDEGNEDGIVRYGTSCAARALGYRQGGAARVRKLAANAHYRTVTAAREARDMLNFYGVPDDDNFKLVDVACRYAVAHQNAVWAPDKGYNDWMAMAQDMINRKRAAIAAAKLIGVNF